jgi:long-chain acyl-CoA synthetase
MRLSQLIARNAHTNPSGPATRLGGRQHSWSELVERVACLGAALKALGVVEGDRVAMLSFNSDRYFQYFFACAWIGAVFVPVNTRLAAPEVSYWLNDSESSVLFVDDNLLAMAQQLKGELPNVRTVIYCGDGAAPAGLIPYERLIGSAEAIAPEDRGGEQLAGLFYTGGTTGRSKGVMLSHRNLIANAEHCLHYYHFDSDTVYLHTAPMFHLANGTCMFPIAAVGGSSVFVPTFDAQAVMLAIEKYSVSSIFLVPTMISMLLDHPQFDKYDLSSLRVLLYGASPMPEQLIRLCIEKLPQTALLQLYGQTEAAPNLTQLAPERHVMHGPKAGKIKSAGQAMIGCEVRIFDGNDNEVPRGVIGQVVARGDNVMIAYWKQPEMTADVLRGGWLHTGDGGYMDDDDFVFVVDRVKDMIISGGENIYSIEVENAIYSCTSVAQCAVIGVPDDKWGEKVHAIVQLKTDHEISADALIEHCKGLIASYKCPRSIEFTEEALPISGAGKILKSELRQRHSKSQ